MKSECSSASGKCCSWNIPSLLPFLVRMVIGIMFLVMGVGKLMSPDMFQGMLAGKLALSGELGMVAYWLVVVFEGLGGLAVILGKLVPRGIYKIALLGQLVIIFMAYFTVILPNGDQPWFHLLMVASILGLMFSYPKCPMGVTGCKSEAQCDMK